MRHGTVAPAGDLQMHVIIGPGTVRSMRARLAQVADSGPWPARELRLAEIARHGLPRRGLDDRINTWRTANFRNLLRGVRRVLAARTLHLPTFYGSLYLTQVRDDELLELGLASMRVVTTAGVGFLVDAFQNSVELETMKYHGLGTGTNSEASADTALQTELTTQYETNNTRPTGTTTEGASANIYRTVATNTVDASAAITEHGIFSQAANSGGVLLDRSVFSAVNLASGDGLQSTYDLTLPAGS